MNGIFAECAPRSFRALIQKLNPPATTAVDVWTAQYWIAGFMPNSARYVDEIRLTEEGFLSLECSNAGNEKRVKVNHSNRAHPGDCERFTADIRCRHDSLCSPLDWSYTQRFEKLNDPRNMTGIPGGGSLEDRILIRDGKKRGGD